MSKLGGFGFFVGLIFGAYFIIEALGLFALPVFSAGLDKIIIIVSAALMAIAGIYFYKYSRNSMSRFMNKIGFLGIAIYFVFALYLLNVALNLVPAITSALSGMGKWINLVTGILLVVGGISFWSQKRY